MRIVRDYNRCPLEARSSVVTIGNFDGLHKGHVTIINKVKSIARTLGVKSGIITFEPHPLKILKNLEEKNRITPFLLKARLLEEMGIDFMYVIRFSRKFALLTKDEFIDKLLVNSFSVKHVVVGRDFIFGQNREGSSLYLEEAAKVMGFGVTLVDNIKDDDERFSSSRIRKFIAAGNVEKALELLGRPYMISGRVIKGEKLARSMGFPTINLKLHEHIRPKYGVYKAQLAIAGEKKIYQGIANIGRRPTFGGNSELLEVHLQQFNQDIYNKKVTVSLLSFIREERKFADMQTLKEQIIRDLENV